MSAELFYSAEQFVDVQRIFADDARLEHFYIRRAGRVAHFAVSHDAGVGKQFYEYHVFGQTVYFGHPQIGNF